MERKKRFKKFRVEKGKIWKVENFLLGRREVWKVQVFCLKKGKIDENYGLEKRKFPDWKKI